jgi:hypothetical protein
MSMLQVSTVKEPDEWYFAQHSFSVPVKVVGLWLMSDGDNTKSNFSVLIKDLEILE